MPVWDTSHLPEFIDYSVGTYKNRPTDLPIAGIQTPGTRPKMLSDLASHLGRIWFDGQYRFYQIFVNNVINLSDWYSRLILSL